MLTTADLPFHRRFLAIAALFCLLGFQYSSWASRLPALAARLGLDTAEVGLLLLATGIGAAASYPLVTLLLRRLGSPQLATLAGLALGVVLIALAVTPDYPVTLVIMAFDGVAVACLNVAMNAQGAALEVRYARTAMSRLHATFSGGSLVAALLATVVTALTPVLAVHLGIALAVLLLLVAAARTGLLPQDLDTAPAEPASPPKRRRISWPARVTLLLGLAMVFGTITEGAMNDWSALYLRTVAHAGAALAPLGIAVVSAMMVLARLFADRWRARWGDGRIVLVGSALAGIGLAAALLVGGAAPALVGFACVGLGIAAVTPCVYFTAAQRGGEALTLVATMGTVGLLAGPPVIGFIANTSSLSWGLAAVAASALLVCLCAARIDWPSRAADTPATEPALSAD
jgi:MFS family permease